MRAKSAVGGGRTHASKPRESAERASQAPCRGVCVTGVAPFGEACTHRPGTRNLMRRAYGDDSYWIHRYEQRASSSGAASSADNEATDEWLFSYPNLKPLLKIRSGASLVDLGCGTSMLTLDAVADLGDGSRAVGADIAPAAIEYQLSEQRARAARGCSGSMQASFVCKDICRSDAWEAESSSFDVCIDKATTDGLLCDTKRGAARVRSMYAAIAPALRPEALVAVLSWRSPERDGVEWCIDCVLGGLREGSVACEDDDDHDISSSRWTLDVHSIVREVKEEEDGEALDADQGPHVYLLRRRPRRRSRRRIAVAQRLEEDGSDELEMRHHVHTVS